MNQKTEKLTLSEEQRNQLLKELGSLLKENMALKQELREQEKNHQAFNEELFLEMLEVFDSLEFLVTYLAENSDKNPQFFKRLPKSLATTQKKLLTVLARRGVTLIDFQETKPDFSLCQVVDREVRNDLEEQTITKIVRSGFLVNQKTLRPVEVITAKHSSLTECSPGVSGELQKILSPTDEGVGG